MALTIDRTIRSPNWSPRPRVPDMLVLHSGEGTKQSDLYELTDADRPLADRVSAHYYVDRAGNIYELVDPDRAAWHAGTSAWAGRTSAAIRDLSIGIETEHKQGQDWPAIQRAALAELCRYLIDRFSIPQNLIVAHRWIAPRRKIDPTNWPDAELRPWIAALYADDPFREWGDIDRPVGPARDFAIPQAWLRNKATLGPCVRGERYDVPGEVSRALFRRGEIRYLADRNVAEVLPYPAGVEVK